MAELNVDKMAKSVAERAIQELKDNGVFVARWIPVSERLPEESGSYLTTTRNNAVRVNHFYAGHGHQVFGYRNNVIAWMPLPEPYKDESDIKSRKEWPYKPCINYEDGCEEWAGCPCAHYKAESGGE